MVTVVLFVCFIILLMMKVPVSISMGTASLIALLIGDYPLMSLPQKMGNAVMSYTLMAVPFFIFAGNLMNAAGLTKRIFNFAFALVGHIRGGLAQVNILASMIFAGISGSFVADTAGLGTVEMKAMTDRHYDKYFSAAVTVSSSILGPIIPPSIILIVYAVAMQVSIARIFLAGVVPGIVVGFLLMVGVYIIALRRPMDFPREKRLPFAEFLRVLRGGMLAVISPIIILWGMVGGVITPTEAGILAVIWSLFVGIVYKEFSIKVLPKVLYESFLSSAHIMFLISVGSLMGWIITMDGTAEPLAESVLKIASNKYLILIMINIIALVIGCLMEPTPALLVTLPIFSPFITQLNIDPLHFGIMLTFNLCIGMLTPPVGLGLFVMCSITDLKFGLLARAVIPFLFILFIGLMIITYIPWLSCWLPRLVMPYSS
ncbi:TRAP transporter large permease [Thermodesulfobacteriota bacterium]